MQVTEKEFLKHVSNHEVTVLREDGVYRHVRFKQPETGNRYFDLITWPGMLCYCGDMGTFVFSRVNDMFTFFRNDPKSKKLSINLGYWAEKLQASDRDGAEEFSQETYKKAVRQHLKSFDASREVKRAAKEEILDCPDDNEQDARRVLDDFEHDGFRFTDMWEYDFKDYTYRFVWACYAITWGIREYDKQRATSDHPQLETAHAS